MMCILQHSKLANAVKWSDAELLHQPLGPKDYRVKHALQQFLLPRAGEPDVQVGPAHAGALHLSRRSSDLRYARHEDS